MRILALILTTILLATPAAAYDVKCADTGYWDKRLDNSPVTEYVVLKGHFAADYFLTALDLNVKNSTTGVTVLYNPQRASRIDGVGIVVFEDGCARDNAILAPKALVDSVLAEMLHKGVIE